MLAHWPAQAALPALAQETVTRNQRLLLSPASISASQRFGAGYGEENDFCIRATGHGWRHILAMDTYVCHVGGVSFGTSKNPREAAAQTILHQLHPTYETTIQAHVAADPARVPAAALPPTLQPFYPAAQSIAAGAATFIVKPFSGDKILAAMRLFEKRSQPQPVQLNTI